MTYGPLNGIMTTFTYDERNRLTAVGNFTYEYDAEGNRISITEGSDTTDFVNMPGSLFSTIMKTDSQGNTTYYIYGNGLVSEITDTDTTYYHYDYKGNTVALTDSTGVTTDTFKYSPFGGILSRTGTYEPLFQYSGKYGIIKDETSMYYMRARYYSVDVQRFISRDTYEGMLGTPLTLNNYAYGLNNPFSYVDPSGHMNVQQEVVIDPSSWIDNWYKGTGKTGKMEVSQDLIEFLKQYETFEPEAYRGQDSQNQTIGYGHVILPGEDFGTMTIKEAEDLLRKDLQSRVDYVNQQNEEYNLDLNQHQFDGLVDMVFNKGQILTPEKATFFKLIVESGADDDIFYQFSRWNKAGGEFSLGVYRRSCDEADIFLYGEYIRDYRERPVEIP